jgi:hypothetical protein
MRKAPVLNSRAWQSGAMSAAELRPAAMSFGEQDQSED